MDDKWYYTFDPVTKKYTGAVLSNNAPENATLVEPQGIIDTPIYDEKLGQWSGMTIEEYQKIGIDLDPGKTAEELISDLTQKFAVSQLAQIKLNATLVQQNAELVKQVADLQSEKETTNG